MSDREKFNRKHYFPRGAGNPRPTQGLGLKRSRHLASYNEDITICFPTYPGPGQRPDSNVFSEANYDPPKDWPPHGAILRAPQVVWLSCETSENSKGSFTRNLEETRFETFSVRVFGNFNYYDGTFGFVPNILLTLAGEYGIHTSTIFNGQADNTGGYDFKWIDGETNTYVKNGDLGFNYILTALGPQTIVSSGETLRKDGKAGRPYWLTTSIANPYQPIFDHYHNDVFPEVKQRIEALRAGRTWVEVIDWFDTYTDPKNDYWNKDDQNFVAMYVPMCVAAQSLSDHFFGTDFLHIFIGHVSEVLSSDVWNGDTDGDVYQQSRGEVVNAWYNYAGYTVLCFNLTVSYDDFAAATDFPVVIAMPPALPIYHTIGPVYSDDGGITFHNPPLEEPRNVPFTQEESWIQAGGVDGAAQLAQNIVNQKKVVSDFNKGSTDTVTMLRNTMTNEAQYVVDMCEDLKDFGYVYVGDGASLSADDIISLIADHYGFDPSTGKDK